MNFERLEFDFEPLVLELAMPEMNFGWPEFNFEPLGGNFAKPTESRAPIGMDEETKKLLHSLGYICG